MLFLNAGWGWPGLCSPAKRPRQARPRTRPLIPEVLEDRLCPSGGYLLVPSGNTDSVIRYDESSGASVDALVPARGGGPRSPTGTRKGLTPPPWPVLLRCGQAIAARQQLSMEKLS